jgi:hypothetical protein
MRWIVAQAIDKIPKAGSREPKARLITLVIYGNVTAAARVNA